MSGGAGSWLACTQLTCMQHGGKRPQGMAAECIRALSCRAQSDEPRRPRASAISADLLSRIGQQQLGASHTWQCNRHSLPRASTQLGFAHVRGLWGLLGMAVAAGVALAAMPHLSYAAGRAWQRRRAAAARTAAPSTSPDPSGRRRWLPLIGGLLRRSRSVHDQNSLPALSDGGGSMGGAKLGSSWHGSGSTSAGSSTDCLKGAGDSSAAAAGDLEAPPPVEQLPAPGPGLSPTGSRNDSVRVAALAEAHYVAEASARSLRALLQQGPRLN